MGLFNNYLFQALQSSSFPLQGFAALAGSLFQADKSCSDKVCVQLIRPAVQLSAYAMGKMKILSGMLQDGLFIALAFPLKSVLFSFQLHGSSSSRFGTEL